MKNFEYVSARTIEEAVAALAESKGPARPIAGGTDLVVQLNEGRRVLDRVVGLEEIPQMRSITLAEDGALRLGAATPCAVVYKNIAVRSSFPMLVDSTSIVGSVQVQSRASVGGNLCNAAPSGDCIPTLICLGAQAVVVGPEGRRVVPVEEFCTGPGTTILKEAELLTELHIPAPQENEGGVYQRFIPRNEMDIAVVGAGSWVRVDPASRKITAARIALASVAPTPLRVPEAERVLVGYEIDEGRLQEAATIAREAAKPISDVRGSADYRRHLVEVLVIRTLKGALQRAGLDTDMLKGSVSFGG